LSIRTLTGVERTHGATGEIEMRETPESWLRDLFEFEYCGECGGDAEDHEVCMVPGLGTYFARCLRPPKNDVGSKPTSEIGDTTTAETTPAS
jgi:hypothetical protein